jgi:hypothetical protein
MNRLAPAVAAAFIAAVFPVAASDALDFWRTNAPGYAAPRAKEPQDIRPDRARIHVATTEAAKRHGVPVEFMHRLTKRESGYEFLEGPPTQWGRAQGPHQILCGTARELGERDCGRLMRDADRSADLAARYVRMGYEATGSWHGAAAYYHGGPDTRLWGRKTRAYAAAVSGVDAPFPRTLNASGPARGTFGNVPIVVAAFAPDLPAAFVPGNEGRASR